MYGENGEVEYGGDMKNAMRPTQDINDRKTLFFKHTSLIYWKKHGLDKKSLKSLNVLI